MKLYFNSKKYYLLFILISITSCNHEDNNEFNFLLTGNVVGTITGTRSDNTTPINGRLNYPYSTFFDEAWFNEDEQLIIVNLRKTNQPIFTPTTSYIEIAFRQAIGQAAQSHDDYHFFIQYKEILNSDTEFELRCYNPGGAIVSYPDRGPLQITNFKEENGFVTFDYEVAVPGKYNTSNNDCVIAGSARIKYIKEVIN
jgi:hypothetical protein